MDVERQIGRLERRGFLAALGAVAGLSAAPAWAVGDFEDVSQPISKFPVLFGTRENFIGSTVKKLPRARAAGEPLRGAGGRSAGCAGVTAARRRYNKDDQGNKRKFIK